MEEPLLILTNLPDAQSAQTVARKLVESKLTACINILPAVQAIYRWKGAIEEATEVTLMIKTTRARYAELECMIKEMHPYEVPEIIGLPILAGLPNYLAWIAQETKKDVNA
jgi:periplasmic divalent cation tolerance protein